MTHEQVVNQLDDETVSYEVGFGVSDAFTENFRVSIKVELSAYEKAIAWLRDLVYGAVFDKERSVPCCCSFLYLCVHGLQGCK